MLWWRFFGSMNLLLLFATTIHSDNWISFFYTLKTNANDDNNHGVFCFLLFCVCVCVAYRTYREPQILNVCIGLSSQITIHSTENKFAEKFHPETFFFSFLLQYSLCETLKIALCFLFFFSLEEIWFYLVQHMNFLSTDANWKVFKNIPYSNLA